MNNKTDKNLDDLTRKVMNNAFVESPSVDFTSSVMSHVSELNKSTIFYKPLISKLGWFFIFIMILSLVIYSYISGSDFTSSSFLNDFDVSVLYDNKFFNTLSGFKVSKTFVYAIVLFGLMFSIQIPFLKHHFNKQLQ